MKAAVPIEAVERKISHIRGQKVMLDSDLAELYGVTTKRLNEQVKRNISRFPRDFMFQLTESEMKAMGTNCDRIKFSHPVAKCDRIQEECPIPPLRFYRTRRHHGGECSEYKAGN